MDAAKFLELKPYNPKLTAHLYAANRLIKDFIAARNSDFTVHEIIQHANLLLAKLPVTGYVGFLSYKHDTDTKVWHVSFLGVETKYRGLGYGKAILEKFIAWLSKEPGKKTISIGVNADNAAAKALYTSLGFVVYKTGVEQGMAFEILKKEIN